MTTGYPGEFQPSKGCLRMISVGETKVGLGSQPGYEPDMTNIWLPSNNECTAPIGCHDVEGKLTTV